MLIGEWLEKGRPKDTFFIIPRRYYLSTLVDLSFEEVQALWVRMAIFSIEYYTEGYKYECRVISDNIFDVFGHTFRFEYEQIPFKVILEDRTSVLVCIELKILEDLQC